MESRVERLGLAELPRPPKIPKAFFVPFLSDEQMEGRPPCSARDFKKPRLRKCCLDLATMNFKRSRYIGGGLDGCVWKIRVGGQTYALKVFWDTEPELFTYFAAQRECQNAALLQMMEAAVEDVASGSMFPILLNPNPTTRDEAKDNTLAFSDQVRQGQLSRQTPEGAETMRISSIPRMRKCYGWTKIHGRTISAWPRKMRPEVLKFSKVTRSISSDEEYTAIVYEYVENGDNDDATVEQAADFLWRAGFGYTWSSLARNWKSSVLVDLSDIIHVRGFGWHVKLYGPRRAERILIS